MEPNKRTDFRTLDEFRILDDYLGDGCHSSVKKAEDENGKLVAIKVYKEKVKDSVIQNEVSILKELKHQTIVQFIDVRENATFREGNRQFKCRAIILEYLEGGQFFNFIMQGKLTDSMIRPYFYQIMNGLHFIHSKGYAHRDIKPENLLLTDFGFSCPLIGQNNQRILHSCLGTQQYMASEIYQKNYEGDKADIFAAGVILFIMCTGQVPFKKAKETDKYYNLIKTEQYEKFWKIFEKRKIKESFTPQFKDLFLKMVAHNPKNRATIEQIMKHAWFNCNADNPQQIQEKVVNQQIQLGQQFDQEKQEQEEKKIEMNSLGLCRYSGGSMQDESQLEHQQKLLKDPQFPHFEINTTEDFFINKNEAEAITLLKEFFSTPIQSCQTSITLKASQVQEKNGQFMLTYRKQTHSKEKTLEDEMRLSIGIIIEHGDKVLLMFRHQMGDKLSYKKVVKEIKGIFANG